MIMEVRFVYPVPRHLINIFQADADFCNEYNLEGKICCDCGCSNFKIKLYADTDSENFPHVSKYKDNYALTVRLVCKECRKEWLLFDMSRHGYNGYVCHEGVAVPDSELKEYTCSGCNENTFEINVGIEVEDKEQFIKDVVDFEPDRYHEEDYVDAFDWINIDIKCCCCREWIKGWINFETS